jgi:drug/metabolite transporter (DMT)-like permease
MTSTTAPTPTVAAPTSTRWTVILSLLAVYLIWGSTYFFISIAIENIPPLLMAGSRFLISGTLLLLFIRVRGLPMPTLKQWGYGALFGTMLLGLGNGGVTFAEQSVSSSLAALIIATTPLWVVIWSALGGKRPGKWEIVGVVLGFAGILLLNIDGDIRADGLGILIIIGASMSWALGTVWKRGAETAPGFAGTMAEMLCAGVLMLVAGLLRGERLGEPIVLANVIDTLTGSRPIADTTLHSLLAYAYLVIFGGIIAYSAFGYLIHNVRPTLATSYAYVNPVIAVALGVLIGNESIGQYGLPALVLIVGGVALLILKRE